jgi:hypothetical protein
VARRLTGLVDPVHHRSGPTTGTPVYGADMASPTGPVPVGPDPDDPDDPAFWNWDDDDDEGAAPRSYVRTAVVVILVLGLVVLLMASL